MPVSAIQRALAHPLALVGLQTAGLWPVWQWYGRRLLDGSDEGWGLIALCAVPVLLWSHRRNLSSQPRSGLLIGAGVLTLLSAAASPWLHMLPRAMLGMSALGLTLAAVLDRPHAILPVWSLLWLSLPVISSMQLQLYLGYPLRAFTTWASREALAGVGLEVVRAGTTLTWKGRTVLVDAPCSGIRMLWAGLLLATLLSHLRRARASRFLLNVAVAFPIILAGNVLRNVLLFLKEAGILVLPAWTHAGIGLLAFLLTSVLIAGFTCWRTHAYEDALYEPGPTGRFAPRVDSGGSASTQPAAGG